MPPMIAIGCLKRSLLMLESAVCIMRVSLVICDMRKPDCILLKKSIDWRIILLKSWARMSVSTLLLTQFM